MSPGKYKGAGWALHSLYWGIFLMITSGSHPEMMKIMHAHNKAFMTSLEFLIGANSTKLQNDILRIGLYQDYFHSGLMI